MILIINVTSIYCWSKAIINTLLDIHVYILGRDISSKCSGISCSPVLKNYLNEIIFLRHLTYGETPRRYFLNGNPLSLLYWNVINYSWWIRNVLIKKVHFSESFTLFTRPAMVGNGSFWNLIAVCGKNRIQALLNKKGHGTLLRILLQPKV